ncbi:MAG: hypothetical protein DWB56_12370 [Candidatus Jettenia sp.]|uniref:hypothetical protein n=1 Tax=Candidatus Jettenia sp. AMX1 TaxID=2293637 RepID=UPI0002D429C5|nr:hypothetical protein [Candidatus Jettenia sp. AMX1]MBC6929731.1 hypothetical protein [Candidatus Jettenia sp.]NUN23752.1 hypothetical protein [Candidatus Jettenia caeni]KAA0248728.1 MAG: hypothetical protein EDM77_11565 [Candidatus Jettenia sp. AMX1]MCE7880647.1 hypothetical protein [Candidatus Jettenia sp. AMX1]MCQ3927391.1 hypothetical protein [Candidatus Jettenia sp.]
MRERNQQGSISVNAIAGTYVVLLGINMKEDACKGLLGFAIERTDRTEEEHYKSTTLAQVSH